MMQTKRDFWSYFTAFWEGEGHLTLCKGGVQLAVTQKSRIPLKYIKANLKLGKIPNRKQSNGVSVWKVTRRLDVIRILERMLPLMVSRGKEVERKLETLKEWERNYSTVGWTDEEEEVLRQNWKTLNDKQLTYALSSHSAEAINHRRSLMGLTHFKPLRFRAEENELIRKSWEQLTDREIAQKLGKSAQAVQQKRLALGLKKQKGLKGLKGSKKKFKFDEAMLKDLYVTQKLSSNMIASIFGCCSETVRHRLQRYGVARRDAYTQSLLRKRDPNGAFA